MNRIIDWYRRLDVAQEKTWVRGLLTALMMVLSFGGAAFLVAQTPEWAMTFVGADSARPWIWASVGAIWASIVIWMGLFVPVFLTIVLSAMAAVIVGMIFGLPAAAATLGIGVLTVTFLLLTQVLLLVLRYPAQPLAIAHTVVKEAMRLRISAFFIIVLLVALPLIPVFASQEQELRYRIQTFISWSVGLTFSLAACMTIFLACATVSFEIRDRQIWQLMTKPVSRINYLIGKWIGIVGINLVLIAVCGVSIFGVIDYMEDLPTSDVDRVYIRDTILTARVIAQPEFDRLPIDDVRLRAEQMIESDRTLKEAIDAGLRDEFIEKRLLMRRIQEEYLNEQRQIPPGEERVYTFKNLNHAIGSQQNLELRYQFHILDNDTHSTHWATFFFPHSRTFPAAQQIPPFGQEYVPTMRNSLTVRPDLVEEDGTFQIVIFNGRMRDGVIEPGRGPIFFDPDGVEVYYTVGSFQSNFVRGMVVIWTKLAFLAMLGIATATVLSFPVATLFSFTVFLAAAISPFLALSLNEFVIRNDLRVDLHIVKFVAGMLVTLLGTFGDYAPTKSLVRGELIPWLTVLKGVGLMGIIWTGLSLGLGYFFFRDRELATYSGQG